jgi:diadenosine tetraphosphate (Ap4A) HIT family hydrolase
MTYSATIPLVNVDQSYPIKNYGNVQVQLSKNPLAEKSVIVTTSNPKGYVDWTQSESAEAFTAFKEIANVWKAIGLADQYLVYGRQAVGGGDKSFRWEAVPYYKTSNWVSEVWQQIVVLWKIAMGALGASEETLQAWSREYETAFIQKSVQTQFEAVQTQVEVQGKIDPFCNPVQFEKQCVLEGDKVRVLYNYAPIGLGDEKLHFLFMPKRHEADFNKFTEEEYLEIADLSKKMIVHFAEKTQLEDIHLFRKFGKDAGQTVFHGHLHMVLTATKTENFWGFLKVAKNILFNSSPLSEGELKSRVEKFRVDLKPIQETY